ncbi:phage portal protein [Streptomyces collinus]|uniref:phage portal protein n=1 Tax=Streptomyces collinus TaxID=42684 RepID=UPI003677EBB6
MATAVYLPTLTISGDELAQVEYMLERLTHYIPRNRVAEAYYEGRNKLKSLNITIPPHLRDLETVVGWAGTAVDVLDERLEWQGWTSVDGNDLGLGEIYNGNQLDVDAGLAHLDTLIYGTGFVVVGAGYEGEPSPLITVESAKNMTGIYDNRLRRLTAALGVNSWCEDGAEEVTLYTPYANITLAKNKSNWTVIDRDDHNLGRVMVAQMTNRTRASRQSGRSEITRAIRSYVDQGMRTMLGMEINREFYSVPQRYILGADMDMFLDDQGNPIDSWATVAGRMTMLPDPINDGDEDPDPARRPTIGQFSAASPAPYLDQVRGLSQMVAAECAIPASYFGFVTSNPSSADAIRQEEARLIKRAERRQLMFGRTWMEVGKLSLLVRDGKNADLSAFNNVSVKWRDAATPTRSAAADEAVKLISAGVLPADSTVTYDRLGLSPQEQRQLENDKRRAQASQRISEIAAAVQATKTNAPAVEAAAASQGASEEAAA